MPVETAVEPAWCHGVMARLVEEPDRLTPGAVGDAGLDVDRLRQVTGFITKVRHNPVRFRLPLTMRALAAAGLEIDFFADIAPSFGKRRRLGLTDDQRVELFVDGLRGWLDPADDAHRLVADVLAHELTMLEVAQAAPVAAPEADAVVDAHSRPRLRAGVRLLHLTVHPPDVVDAAPGTAVDRSPRYYAYVPTPAGPRVKSVEPALVPLVDRADGSATVLDIATSLGLGAAVDRVAGFFQVLARRGLVDAA